MKKFTKIFAVVLALLCLCSGLLTASAADYTDAANDPTTNWTISDSKTKVVYSKPMYEAMKSIESADIGVDSFKELADIYSRDGKIYILDTGTGAGKIIITDENFNLIKTISSVTIGDKTTTFEGARGVIADKNGNIYVCDTSNYRVVIMDSDGNFIGQLTKPDSEMWPDELLYMPTKLVIDEMDYVYVLCDGSYYGAAMYTPEYEFQGFFGANTVSSTILEAMNKLSDLIFNNNTKRSKSIKSLPFSFVDMEIGADGYIYTCTGTTTWSTTATGSIKRLNPVGKNILLDKTKTEAGDSSSTVFATKDTSKKTGLDIKHDISAITVDENNFIYALDSAYGRVYVYDTECNLLTTLGGGVSSGTQIGTFQNAKAITTLGDNVYVLDSVKNTIAVFKKNDYGKLVQQAQTLNIKGDYADAESLWLEVLKQDRNSILAYKGIAKVKLLNEEYEAAMEYAKLGYDRSTYSQAYEYVRTEKLSKHFTLIVAVIVVVIVALILWLRYKKKHNIVLIKNKKLKIALATVLHPADSFYEIKRNGQGSVLIATAFLVVWYIFKIIGLSTGFIFNEGDTESVNAWYALAQTFGLVILFAVANWAVCVLFEGKGKLKDIYTVTCYSLMPMIIQSIGYDILSNVLTLSESSYISILNYVCLVITAVILVMGLITIQEFTFGKFVLTTIITVLAMLLIIFLAFMIGILLQQAGNFVETVFMEAFYR